MNTTTQPPATAMSKIDTAVEAIRIAQQLNDQMQRQHQPGTTPWHHHETIDDRLHEALAALGE
jgi:hypothetical protein